MFFALVFNIVQCCQLAIYIYGSSEEKKNVFLAFVTGKGRKRKQSQHKYLVVWESFPQNNNKIENSKIITLLSGTAAWPAVLHLQSRPWNGSPGRSHSPGLHGLPGHNGVLTHTRLDFSKYLAVITPVSIHSNWQRLRHPGKRDNHAHLSPSVFFPHIQSNTNFVAS